MTRLARLCLCTTLVVEDQLGPHGGGGGGWGSAVCGCGRPRWLARAALHPPPRRGCSAGATPADADCLWLATEGDTVQ